VPTRGPHISYIHPALVNVEVHYGIRKYFPETHLLPGGRMKQKIVSFVGTLGTVTHIQYHLLGLYEMPEYVPNFTTAHDISKQLVPSSGRSGNKGPV
jgi:hypothetical protein